MTPEALRTRWSWLMSQLPVGIIAVSVAIVAGFLALGVSRYAVHAPATVGTFLNTLALAQASVLAIVFSVVILAVQLTASKYSNQITDIYVRSPVFVATFGLFLLSIGFDLALLYSYPTLVGSVTRSMLYVASGLAVVVAIWLVYFIQFTFTQLTPEGIVSMFERDITPGKSRRVLRANREDDLEGTETNHPLLPLHSLTVQAIRNDERFTASKALRELGTQTVGFLDESTGGTPPDAETLDLMYGPVLTTYLPEIIEDAGDSEMEELAVDGLAWIYRIGRAGGTPPTDRVARLASDGFEVVIDRHAIDPTNRQTLVTAWEEWGALVTDLCVDADVETIQHAFSGFEQQLNLLGKQDHDEWVRQGILLCFFTDLQHCHETLLDRFGATVADLEVPWEQRFLPTDGDRERAAAQLLVKCRNLLVRFSSMVLDHLVETDEYPIRFNSFQGLWADLCSNSVRHAPPEYARTICEIYIEVASVSVMYERDAAAATVGPRRRTETWASTLDRIARTEKGAVVARAFDAVLDEDATRFLTVSSAPSITRTDAYPGLVDDLRVATGV